MAPPARRDASVSAVCVLDGVPVGESRSGRLVHLDDLPLDVEPHDVVVTLEATVWAQEMSRQNDLAVVAAEMLNHHDSIHPASDCEFSRRLEAALRSPRT